MEWHRKIGLVFGAILGKNQTLRASRSLIRYCIGEGAIGGYQERKPGVLYERWGH